MPSANNTKAAKAEAKAAKAAEAAETKAAKAAKAAETKAAKPAKAHARGHHARNAKPQVGRYRCRTYGSVQEGVRRQRQGKYGAARAFQGSKGTRIQDRKDGVGEARRHIQGCRVIPA